MLATFLLLDTADSPIGLEDDKKGRRHVLLSLFFPPTHHSLFLGEDCDDIENSHKFCFWLFSGSWEKMHCLYLFSRLWFLQSMAWILFISVPIA